MKTLDEYLELPYRITIVHDRDDDGNEGFVAEVEELPGCLSQGSTPEEAVSNVYDAMAGWISVALEDGHEIPEPRDPGAYTGRFLASHPPHSACGAGAAGATRRRQPESIRRHDARRSSGLAHA